MCANAQSLVLPGVTGDLQALSDDYQAELDRGVALVCSQLSEGNARRAWTHIAEAHLEAEACYQEVVKGRRPPGANAETDELILPAGAEDVGGHHVCSLQGKLVALAAEDTLAALSAEFRATGDAPAMRRLRELRDPSTDHGPKGDN